MVASVIVYDSRLKLKYREEIVIKSSLSGAHWLLHISSAVGEPTVFSFEFKLKTVYFTYLDNHNICLLWGSHTFIGYLS